MFNRLTTLIVIRRRTPDESRWYAWVVYAPRGEVEVMTDPSKWKLSHETGALLVVNPREQAVVYPSAGALCVAARIDMRLIRRLLNDREITFFCDPLRTATS